MPEPWTRTFALNWAPELRFYEERTTFLRALQDDGKLRAFRMSTHAVEARIFDGEHELSLRHNGLTLECLGQRHRVGDALEVVEAALALLQPARMTAAAAALQYAVALDCTFGDALSRAHAEIFRELDFVGGSHPDFALLVDVALDQPLRAEGAIEVGIIRGSEIGERLARSVGRRQESGKRSVPPRPDAPDVALFADGMLLATGLDAPPTGDDFLRFWDASGDKLGSVVAGFERRIRSSESAVERSGGDEQQSDSGP